MINLRHHWFWFLLLTSIVVFGQVIFFEYLNYDDPAYVTANPLISQGLSWNGLKWAATQVGETNLWHPVTWLSHQIDVSLFSLRGGPAHAVNLCLHLLAGILLWQIGLEMGLKRTAGWIALAFLLHPSRVQVVAWVSERKELLSVVFVLAATWCCIVGANRVRLGRFWMSSLVFFGLSLLSKPVAVGWGIWLLAYESKMLRERPALARIGLALTMGAGVALIAMHFQSTGGMASFTQSQPWPQSLIIGLASLWTYAKMAAWPWPLPLWIYPPAETPWAEAGAALCFIILTGVVAWRSRRTSASIWLGWLWAFLFWLPVSGLVTVSFYATADRYTYAPSIGVLLLLAGIVEHLFSIRPFSPRLKALAKSCGAHLLLCWAILSFIRTQDWKNSETLFAREMAINPRSLLAPIHLGQVRMQQKRFAEALLLYQKAAAIDHLSGLAHGNIGHAHLALGQKAEAKSAYTLAMSCPRYEISVPIQLALLLDAESKFAEAHIACSQGLTLHPTADGLWAAKGYLQAVRLGKQAEGIMAVQKAVQLAPENAAHTQLLQKLLSLAP